MQNKCRIALEDLQPYLRDPDQWSDDLHRGNFLRGCTARPQSLAKTSRREAVAARSIRRIMLTLPAVATHRAEVDRPGPAQACGWHLVCGEFYFADSLSRCRCTLPETPFGN